MGFLRNLWARLKASTTDTDGWFHHWATQGSESASGVSVNATTAQKCAEVYACVQVVAQDVAKLPLPLYRRLRNGERERVADHPVAKLLAQPNPWQTGFEWRELMQGHLELRGNAYSRIERDGAGRPVALWPMCPDNVRVMVTPDQSLVYEWRRPQHLGGGTVVLQQDDVLHIRERSDDGIVGKSRIAQMRESIGLALAMEEHGARLFSNGATMAVALTTDKKFTSQEEADRARELFASRYSGLRNAWKPAILHNGLDVKTLSMTSDDAQFIETRKMQVGVVARAFRVPPHKIGDLTNATFSNIEHQALEYVVDSLLPRLRRFEERLNASLLDAEPDLYVEFLVDGLLRGDLKSRYEAYGLARQWGWFSVNDIRRLENLPSIGKSGDRYLEPANMIEAGTPPLAPAQPSPKALRAARLLIDEALMRAEPAAPSEGDHAHA